MHFKKRRPWAAASRFGRGYAASGPLPVLRERRHATVKPNSLRYAVESESGDGAGTTTSPAVTSHGPWHDDGTMANGAPWRNERDRIDGGGTLLAA